MKTIVREKRASSGVSTVTRRSWTSSVGKVLYVRYSLAHRANLRLIEESLKCRIRSVKAYSSNRDDKARWPEKNFAQVIQNNLSNPGLEKYDILVMSAPTVDITNLTPSRMSRQECEAKIEESCTNMLNIANEALSVHNLKVVIMDHAPRFDSREKAHLASFANNLPIKPFISFGPIHQQTSEKILLLEVIALSAMVLVLPIWTGTVILLLEDMMVFTFMV